MTAVNDYIIIRKDNPVQKRGNIYLPFEQNVTKNGIGEPYTGTVESVGDMVTMVKNRDKVVFDDLCQPWLVEDKGDLILIIKEKDIIAVLNHGK